jgi:ubiquinone/menaquinone biosynthesis C-methylase UbiE
MEKRKVKIWEKIYEAISDRIKEEDRVFELADIRFGEARRWLIEQANPKPNWLVLEIGYGQGYLTMEMAFVLNRGKVVGIDFLHERITVGVTRWFAKQFGMEKRIALFACDSTKLPFKEESFDAVVSFQALHDIKSTRGSKGVLATVNEACRVVKKNGTIALANDSFPSCKPEGDQGRLFSAIKQYWRNLLPSTTRIIEVMEKNGISHTKILFYDPKEILRSKDAERELRLNVKWAKLFGVNVDFDNFWKEAGEVVKNQGRIFPQIILLRGIKT